MADRWNANIHYARQLLDQLPATARDVLDVGCGEGWLVRELAARVPHVVGLDPDEASIAEARRAGGGEFVQADVLHPPYGPGSFDGVVAVASLHHLDEEPALRAMAGLLRPGGWLGVVGLARSRSPLDYATDVAGAAAFRLRRRGHTVWETPAPKVWPPPRGYSEVRELSGRVLPGRRFARRAMWRYTITWTKPR